MKKLITLLIPFFSVLLVSAQTTSYTISVVDAANNNPVEKASVKIVGRNSGASSNQLGNATLSATPGSKIQVSSVGYNSVIVTLGAEPNVTVALVAASQDLTDVVVLGTRSAPRAKTETAVPIDVIKINQVGASTGKMELTSVLNMAAPSFNYNKQSGSDGADHVDLGTLRGLGPDQTLVLINGKRRHNTALVGLFGTRGKGGTGTDLNAFPQAAVDRIEILRDGASAQYGSDAIAGVINIILKKDINRWNVNAGWAGYYDTKFNAVKYNKSNDYVTGGKIDGQQFSFGVSNGFAIGNSGGFASFAVNYLTQGKTFRQPDSTNWRTDKNSFPVGYYGRRAFGDGSVNTFGASYNLELPIKGSRSTFYSFATVNTKESEAFAYSRNLIGGGSARFPIDVSGNPIFVPSIMQKTDSGETYYNPIIASTINDASLALGLKGITNRKWAWDISVTTGKNDFQFYGRRTFNTSLIGNISKTSFEDGGFRFRQTTFNFDASKSFKGIAEGLNIGYGLEARGEKYSINEGEEASYKNYDPTFTQRTGAQGFPGFSPADTVAATRINLGAYIDAELNVTKAWLISAAVRGENYTDFGAVATYKFATRYKIANNFNVRGAISTGFRAPSLQQINFSNTLTNFVGGVLTESRYARNGEALAVAAGIPKLKQETSVNGSLGFVWKPIKGLLLTVDGYMIKVKNRVLLTGGLFQGDPNLPASFNAELAALNVGEARFLVNSASTTNTGIDVVADYSKKWNNKSVRFLLAGNLQNIKIDRVNVPSQLGGNNFVSQKTFFSDREESLLKASAPASKFTLQSFYNCKKIGFGLTLTSFGAIKINGFGVGDATFAPFSGVNPQIPTDADPNVLIPDVANYKMKLVADIFVSYKFKKGITFFAGADNVLNNHPNFSADPRAKESFALNSGNETGGAWDAVQMGYNGRKLFARFTLDF
jgi:iron complex outermembrane recepter protein